MPRGGHVKLIIGVDGTCQIDALNFTGPACRAATQEIANALFEENKKHRGGFLLLVQTPEWEFATAIADKDGRTSVGAVREQSFLTPRE